MWCDRHSFRGERPRDWHWPPGGPVRWHRGPGAFLLVVALGLGSGASSTSAGQAASAAGSIRHRIERIVGDRAKKLQDKVRELRAVQGELGGAEAARVAKLLEGLGGDLMIAVAEAMNRCGAGRQAFSVVRRIASDPRAAIDRWAPAMFLLHAKAFEMLGAQAPDALQIASAQLVRRLKAPSEEQELLSVLRSKSMLWPPGGWWASDDQVIRQLAALLKHTNREVRSAAAEALATTTALELMRGSAVLPLTKVVEEGDEPAARAALTLLTSILGLAPEGQELAPARVFWREWARREGADFDLTRHALARAKASEQLFRQEKLFLGWQVLHASRELPPARREKAWLALRSVFEKDPSAPGERATAWLRSLVQMAAREERGSLREDALSFLLKLSRDDALAVRQWAFSLIGDLPGATRAGTRGRQALDQVFNNERASAVERAFAAWSLKHAVKREPALAERMIALAETFQNFPEGAFRPTTRSHCIGQICGALSFASGRKLSLNPGEWRQALDGWLPGNR